jgi:hypothetical protein
MGFVAQLTHATMTLQEYEKHLQDRGLNEYILDGAINPEKWTASKIKILFLLKETYGYQKCGIIKISECAHDWLKVGIRTYLKSVPLAATVEIALQRNRPLTQDEINTVRNDSELLHATLEKMAFVNIKKHSGESISNDIEIRDESRKNSSLLKAQIQELAPTIIVAGGNVCWHSLIYDIGLFDAVPECQKFEAVVCNNTILCYANHPSAWSGKGFNIETIQRAIISQCKTG